MVTEARTQAESALARLFDAMNRRDIAAAAECYATDAVVHDPFYPEPLRGRDAIRKDIEDTLGAFPDFRTELRNVLVHDGAYAAEVAARATHTGPLPLGEGKTFEATNRRVEIGGSAHGRVNAEGQIVEERRYIDYLTMMRQLGLIES